MAGIRRILMVTSEAVPFAKSGGLADVVSSLSGALHDRGMDVRILIPYYGFMKPDEVEETGIAFEVPLGISNERARLYRSVLPRRAVPVYLLENSHLYDRQGIYGGRNNVAYPDNLRRFAFLNRAVFPACRALDWIPEIMHLHDWPVGLIPSYLKGPQSGAEFDATASVLTIHNIGYQGVFAKPDIYYTGLSWENVRDQTNPSDQTLNLLRLGVRDADALTTVSPTYSTEIQSPDFGAGLDRRLVERKGELTGILNGIDYEEWNPTVDPLIPHHFDESELAGKALCKAALQRAANLPEEPDVPLIAIVSRLVDQKGFAELADPDEGAIRAICTDMAVQFVVLGRGQRSWEVALQALDLPNFRAIIDFDNRLAHLIEAGADFFLMPSRYEPCGLNQLYSLRYGTLPIVRRTGGLADTVEQYDQESGAGTGFLFDQLTPRSVYDVTGWAVWAWYNRPEHIEQMRRRAMRRRFSWEGSADRYAEVYDQAIAHRRDARG